MNKKLKTVKKQMAKNKRPLILGAVGAAAAVVATGLVRAFRSMKESAKAQHEVDAAEFERAKWEAKADFEEHRGHNTFAAAKASSSERKKAAEAEREARLSEAEAGIEAAKARLEAAKKSK